MAGNAKHPVAIGTYEELYKALDDEFFKILSIFSWWKTGIAKIDISDLPYKIAVGLKYLIDYNEVNKMRLF